MSSTCHVSFLAAPHTDHKHKFSLTDLSMPQATVPQAMMLWVCETTGVRGFWSMKTTFCTFLGQAVQPMHRGASLLVQHARCSPACLLPSSAPPPTSFDGISNSQKMSGRCHMEIGLAVPQRIKTSFISCHIHLSSPLLGVNNVLSCLMWQTCGCMRSWSSSRATWCVSLKQEHFVVTHHPSIRRPQNVLTGQDLHHR